MGWLFPLPAFIDAVGDAVIAVNPSGALQLWNPAAEQLFGFSAQEAFGQSLDLIIPPEFREAHWNGFQEVVRTGRTRLGTNIIRVPALHKAGHQFPILVTVGIGRDANGIIEGIGAIIREDLKSQLSSPSEH